MCINNDFESHRSIPIAWCMILNPIHVRGRQCVYDVIIDIIITSVVDGERCLRRQGLSPISRDVIGLVSRFGSIIVKFLTITYYAIPTDVIPLGLN